MEELVESIENIGIVQPILVQPRDDGYEVIVGSRRVNGSEKAKREKIPGIVKDLSDREALELILVENMHREDLSAVDKGELCRLLLENYPDEYPSQRVLGDKLGVSEGSISMWLKLTELPEDVKKRVAQAPKRGNRTPKGKIDFHTAKRIRDRIKPRERQSETAKRLAEKGASQWRARKIIDRIAEDTERSVGEIVEEELR